MWKINPRLIPIKAHYFFFMAAAGAILPFLPVLARALGVSAAALGFITALLPVAVLIAKPSFGALSDRFPKYRHGIFVCCVVGQAVSLAALGIIPPLHGGHHNRENVTQSAENSTSVDLLPESLYTTATFWCFVTLMCLGNVCFNVANSLSDAICFEMLGEGKELQYGKQRVWGCVGWGGAALLSGASMAWWARSQDEHTGPAGLAPACLLTLVFGAFDTLSCFWLQLPERKPSGSMLKDLIKLVKQKSSALFLCYATLIGVLDGFLIYYLLWYLEDLAGVDPGSMKLIEGLVVAAQTLGGEVLFFPISGWILSKLGHGTCLTLCFSAYALRLALLSIAPGPWWLLPVELVMQGPTYAFGYSIIVAYASAVAPIGTAATVQGIAAGMDDSLGYSIGSLLGGLLYRGLGGRGAFQSMALIALTCCISHMGLNRLINQRSPQSEIPSPETVHLQVSSDKNYASAEIVQLKSNKNSIVD